MPPHFFICLRLLRLTVLKDHHRAHALRALCVGNIIALDAAGQYRQPQIALELLHRTDGAGLVLRQLHFLFVQRLQCIAAHHLDQILLLTALRHLDMHPALPLVTQPFLQHLLLLQLRLHRNDGRDELAVQVKLLDE